MTAMRSPKRTGLNAGLALTPEAFDAARRVASRQLAEGSDFHNTAADPGLARLIETGLAEPDEVGVKLADPLLGLIESLEAARLNIWVSRANRKSVFWFNYYVGDVVAVQEIGLPGTPERVFSPILTFDLVSHLADAIFGKARSDAVDKSIPLSREHVEAAFGSAWGDGSLSVSRDGDDLAPNEANALHDVASLEALWSLSSPYGAVEFAATEAEQVWILPSAPDATNPRVELASRVSREIVAEVLTALLPSGMGDEPLITVEEGSV